MSQWEYNNLCCACYPIRTKAVSEQWRHGNVLQKLPGQKQNKTCKLQQVSCLAVGYVLWDLPLWELWVLMHLCIETNMSGFNELLLESLCKVTGLVLDYSFTEEQKFLFIYLYLKLTSGLTLYVAIFFSREWYRRNFTITFLMAQVTLYNMWRTIADRRSSNRKNTPTT